MKKLIFSTILVLNTISSAIQSEKFLHVNEDNLSDYSKPFVIKNTNQDLVEALHHRYRRDLSSSDRNEGLKNITTKVIKIFTQLLPLSKEKKNASDSIMLSG